jgi:hypothetical protein
VRCDQKMFSILCVQYRLLLCTVPVIVMYSTGYCYVQYRLLLCTVPVIIVYSTGYYCVQYRLLLCTVPVIIVYSTGYYCPILMNSEFSEQFFEKYSTNNFHENPPSGAELFLVERRTEGRTDGRTDVTKLIVAFRNFAKSPKNYQLLMYIAFITVSNIL